MTKTQKREMETQGTSICSVFCGEKHGLQIWDIPGDWFAKKDQQVSP